MFYGLCVQRDGESTKTVLVEQTGIDLPDGDVLVDVSYSDLNFKDGKVMEPGSLLPAFLPLIPGIDLAGTVSESSNPLFSPGDRVVVNGFGLGTDRHGGLTQQSRVPGAWLTRIPSALSEFHAAALGTAGYTAALAVDTLLYSGVRPDSGPVLVTGAGGGVGSIAILLLSAAGFEVVASTGRHGELADSLTELGAQDVIGRLIPEDSPLGVQRWAAAVDSVGSDTLAAVLAQTRYSGTVAAVGLAQGDDLPATVLPFILRGVSLIGIDSVYASQSKRQRAWERLAAIDTELLDSIVRVVGLADAPSISQEVIAGKIHGRVVVDVNQIPDGVTVGR
ncbi:oxidoreductase [Gordonia terrae]|uniref:Oxidoreductase n=1 Tax=Gordonia terrae TaxID=2055 RepID=A0A2I1R4V2_9ACTN|nr:MDR family oxidoreductase [Gordonia terrae]PKZ64161.1 oxidoreductase [Gordonia terrae]